MKTIKETQSPQLGKLRYKLKKLHLLPTLRLILFILCSSCHSHVLVYRLFYSVNNINVKKSSQIPLV